MALDANKMREALFRAFADYEKRQNYFYSYDEDCDWVILDGEYHLSVVAHKVIEELEKQDAE